MLEECQVAPARAGDIEDALAAQDIGATGAQQCGQPFLEFRQVDGPLALQRHRRDIVVVLVGIVGQEVRLEAKNAFEVKVTTNVIFR